MKETIASIKVRSSEDGKIVSQLEFIALMASLMMLVALVMESVLPALGVIGKDVGIKNPGQEQMLITMIFLGIGIGQLISGPLSDSLGRKPLVLSGFLLFVLASFISIYAISIEMMIVSRILQGVGLSAPRTISVAIVRDSYNGNVMAKIMSFVMVIYVVTPAVAPSFGMFMLERFNWEAIFVSQIFIAIVISIWFSMRQRETLNIENRVVFNAKLYTTGIKLFFKSKQAVLYTFILGIINGGFLTFISTAQNLLGKQYGLEKEFPLLFAGIISMIGLSMLFNGVLVVRLGMHKLVFVASTVFTIIAFIYIFLFFGDINPEIDILIRFLSALFLCFGFIIGNLSSLAMQPLGKIAGIGSAIHGFLSTIISVAIAGCIGNLINTTVFPLMFGFFITGLFTVFLLFFVKHEKKQSY